MPLLEPRGYGRFRGAAKQNCICNSIVNLMEIFEFLQQTCSIQEEIARPFFVVEHSISFYVVLNRRAGETSSFVFQKNKHLSLSMFNGQNDINANKLH